MGLDMYVYGIKDVTHDDVPDGMREDWYDDNGYTIIEIDKEDNDFDEMFQDMYPYSVIRNVVFTRTDFNKLKKDYGVAPEAELCMMGSGGAVGFSYQKYYKEIKLSDEEVKKYDVDCVKEALIFKMDELAYWRKEYDLQDLIYENYYADIYNCGFHELDEDLIKKINKYLKSKGMDRQGINDPDYVAKMYHEWY